jgi:hypothetical protein
MIKKLMQLIFMIMLIMGMSAASQAATITVGSATGDAGTQVSIPITIDDTAGRLDCSFSVSFDTTKLEYAGKTSGNMGATLLMASTPDINAAGKAQPIVQFEEGGATSGTIVNFKFNIKSGAAAGKTPLTIGDITPAGTYTGVSGSVTINAAACVGPVIAVGTDTACTTGETVEIPITIEDTAGRLDCSFSVSFDNTKLEYTGKTSGNMGASLLMASTPDINAAGKAQPIVQFEEGGATSGTIVTFKFKLLADIPAGSEVPLTIGDITPADTYCGEDGAVECAEIPVVCTVTISPKTATVIEGGQRTFTASTTGTGCAAPAYSWKVISSIGSTITTAGVYTAGSIPSGTSATDTVTVTDTANGNITDSAVVTVIPKPTVCTVNISPQSATVDCGNTVQFSATTTGTGCATPVYQWSVTSTIGSTISQSGLYKAGTNQTGGNVTDRVRVTDTANNKSATADVTVRDCTVHCLVLTPDITSSPQGQTLKIKLSTAEKMFKDVNKSQIIVDFGEGITVNKIVDKESTWIKVEITIDANANIGTRTILVTTPAQCAEGSFRVTPKPTIFITPPSGRAGTTIETVTITGVLTHFEKGKTSVKFGKNIEVDKKTIVSPTSLTVKIKIGKKATVGSRTVTVTTNLGNDIKEVATGTFIVLPLTE